METNERILDYQVPQELVEKASYSSLTLHRKCPQAWYYRYGLKLKQEDDLPVPFLTVGRWWSIVRAVESLERGRQQGTLVFVPRKLEPEDTKDYAIDPATGTVANVFEAAEKRWRSMTEGERETFTQALGEPLPDRLRGMFHWWDQGNPDRFTDEAPIGVEVYWERNLPISEDNLIRQALAAEYEPPNLKLIGFIDEIFYDLKRGGMVVIRDHKATKQIEVGSLEDMMDSQLELYAWGIAPKLKEHNIPSVRAVGYDRTRSTMAAKPQLTQQGNLSKQSSNYPLADYLAWAAQDTTPTTGERAQIIEELGLEGEQALAVMGLPAGLLWGKLGEFYASGPRKGLPKFGVYQTDPAEVKRLEQEEEKDKWTVRTLTPLNRNTVRMHLQSAVDTALDVWVTQTRSVQVGEAARNLTRWGCKMCDFQKLCQAQMVGGPAGEYDLAAFGLQQKIKGK